jgi:hypothetical protein
MEQPPSWRVVTTSDFDDDCAALSAIAPRVWQVVESWTWYLERVPLRYSEGVSTEDDNIRIAAWTDDERDGLSYYAALTIDRNKRVVLLRWIRILNLLAG